MIQVPPVHAGVAFDREHACEQAPQLFGSVSRSAPQSSDGLPVVVLSLMVVVVVVVVVVDVKVVAAVVVVVTVVVVVVVVVVVEVGVVV